VYVYERSESRRGNCRKVYFDELSARIRELCVCLGLLVLQCRRAWGENCYSVEA